jgi:hypothetical protein
LILAADPASLGSSGHRDAGIPAAEPESLRARLLQLEPRAWLILGFLMGSLFYLFKFLDHPQQGDGALVTCRARSRVRWAP